MTPVLNSKPTEADKLRDENAQLRALCVELEQALHEATQHAPLGDADVEERLREYEALLEQKSEMIRQMHQDLQRSQATVADLENQLASHTSSRPTYSGPAPREDDLMRLAEELERERRQLQEDEQTLMEQMREMEVSLAKERAEIARQRNDLQRLQVEITHELDRLEKCGAVQSKIDQLRAKLHDATSRRGMSPGAGGQTGARPTGQQGQEQTNEQKQPGKPGFLGRLFGG